MNQQSYLSWIHDVDENQKSHLGRKASRLVELAAANIPIPEGFIVFPQAFQEVLTYSHLVPKLKNQVESIDQFNPNDLAMAVKRVHNLIESAEFPKELSLQIFDYYEKLGSSAFVSIRGSISNDTFSSAHQEPYLNIQGDASVIVHIRKMWAHLFTPQNIVQIANANDKDFSFSIIVEKMINSDASGVSYTSSPDSIDKKHIFINAAYGIRDEYIKNTPYPDLYQIDRQTLEIDDRQVTPQFKALNRIVNATTQVEIEKSKQSKSKLVDREIILLTKLSKQIQELYFYPQKIEWASKNGKLFILDTQPISNQDHVTYPQIAGESPSNQLFNLASGKKISPGLATGPFKHVTTPEKGQKISLGDIVYIPNTSLIRQLPLSKVSGIIVESASSNDQNIIYLKSSGVPSVIARLIVIPHEDQIITLDASIGQVLKGSMPTKPNTPLLLHDIPSSKNLLKTATKIYADVSHPDQIAKIDTTLFEGLGLIRGEFLVESLGFQNKDFVGHNNQQLKNALNKQLVNFMEAFSDKPIYYRLHDQINSSESHDSQRGAINYFTDPAPVIAELESVFSAATSQSHPNFNVVIPFIRSPEEIVQFKKIITPLSVQYKKSLPLWAVVETPSAAICIDEILKTDIDGIIIGLNDLTMYTLAVSRSNHELQSIYNATHPAVAKLVKQTIFAANHAGKPCVCAGESLENHHETLHKVVSWGIAGVCISPPAINRIRRELHQIENQLVSSH